MPLVVPSSLSWAHPLVQEWFADRFGTPTEPQEQGWPHILAGRTTLISAPTGSGKTLAAFLACIDRLVRKALAGELQDPTLLLGRHGPHGLSFEGCQLGFELLQALHGIVPVLLEGGCDEAIGRIDGLIAALGEIDLVAGSLDPHAPLRADLVIALFEAGECGERKFDRHWRYGAHQPFGNRLVRPLRHRQTKGAATDMPDLPPPRHIPTLPNQVIREEDGEGQSPTRSRPWPFADLLNLFGGSQGVRLSRQAAPIVSTLRFKRNRIPGALFLWMCVLLCDEVAG